MINYAKHDEEFYGIFKLTSGEEILGKAIITEDEGESLVFISSPVSVQQIVKETDGGKVIKGFGFSKWMQMSDEEFFILREKDILTVASMSKEIIFMYETYNIDEEDTFQGNSTDKNISKLRKSKFHTEANLSPGYLGKIEEARKVFERIFKEPNNP
ncbi:methylamine utilization [Synechococcus phage ACG-2014g]|jgi:hypothetical protein|uniref:Methylamine protein n=1 Tax=Synechococcus phage ACG-2014g TaxID=1493512 RepID=A0A0E3FDD8_9CAUD|nr:methylamine utilization [Synechococcus phage ACG-2014g]AIX24460.1 methylamine protein [Synechococcus phage ACG-2014g]